ncbi:MAG: type III pantothenate kinase [Ferruginibacter sp.]|nr:type III pantothenate kinase [Bacteroidota bacterium]MBX2918043.1 type III pantothenate kinase [Ferruginibacter sp.]MCB0708206.1 type III pantothenate kinase [Chitinophagaceae bacterium]MCC7379568.1 type III pantothenate kinase [Chitinophagaceae bacterium]
MKKTICFDFGNTRLKAAVFIDENFTEEIILPDDKTANIEKLLEQHQPQNTILSSVINHNEDIENLLTQKTTFHKLSHFTKTNFTTPVGKPETIGADRLALSAAAVRFYPGKNNLVISLGSCITYNFINQYNQFLGGSISPGMDMRFKAMQLFTAKLPEVKKDWNFPLIGYDTKTNMQSGVIAGMCFEIDGFINAYAVKYGNFNAVLTGGDTSYFAGQLKNKIFADPYFLFKGLYALSETNNG